jgi:hypothetical protein
VQHQLAVDLADFSPTWSRGSPRHQSPMSGASP